jgi:hypothetical protein
MSFSGWSMKGASTERYILVIQIGSCTLSFETHAEGVSLPSRPWAALDNVADQHAAPAQTKRTRTQGRHVHGIPFRDSGTQ